MIRFTVEELDWLVAALDEFAITYYRVANECETPDMAAVFSQQADQASRLAERIEQERTDS